MIWDKWVLHPFCASTGTGTIALCKETVRAVPFMSYGLFTYTETDPGPTPVRRNSLQIGLWLQLCFEEIFILYTNGDGSSSRNGYCSHFQDRAPSPERHPCPFPCMWIAIILMVCSQWMTPRPITRPMKCLSQWHYWYCLGAVWTPSYNSMWAILIGLAICLGLAQREHHYCSYSGDVCNVADTCKSSRWQSFPSQTPLSL